MRFSQKRSEPEPAPIDDVDKTVSDAESERADTKRAKVELEGRIYKSRQAHANLACSLDKILNEAMDMVHGHEDTHKYVLLANCEETGKLLKIKDEIVKLLNIAHHMKRLDRDEYVDAFLNGEEEWNLGENGVGRCAICDTSLVDGSQCMCSC